MNASNTTIKHNFDMAWPLAFNALLVQSMLMIDTFLVAPLGELPVAAMGIATTIIAFVLGIEIAIGNGIQLLVGRAFGSKSQADLAIAYWSGLALNILTSLIFLLLLAVFSNDLINLITNNTDLVEQVEAYVSITKYIVLLTAYTQVCTAYCNGTGKTKVPLKGFMIELPINALLSFMLINGCLEYEGLGLEGAAWGSLIAILFRSLFLYLTLRFDNEINLSFPKQRNFWKEIKPQFAEIYPIAANFFVLSIGATVYQLLFAQLDLYSFVATTLIFPWLRAATQFPNSWAQASAISISQALGKNDPTMLKEFIPKSTKIGVQISVVVAASLLVLSYFLRWVYPDLAPETHLALKLITPLYIAIPILRAYNTVAGNILRALGDSNLVLKFHIITQWCLALPLCALLILYFDLSVFWVFAILPIEELLKILPFHHYKQGHLKKLQT